MSSQADLISTGVPGLDAVLGGGLRPGHLYFVQGEAGTGKTTLGLQFALEGVRRGECRLFVSLAETIDDMVVLASSHGWDLPGLEVHDLAESGQAVRASALFDLGLPDLDGYELAERLRRLPSLAGSRLIAVTGRGLAQDRRRSELAGIDAHLIKPVSLSDLARICHRGLRSRRVRRRARAGLSEMRS